MLKSIFINIVDLRACNFIKKRLQHRWFPVKFAKFLTAPILKNICEKLHQANAPFLYSLRTSENQNFFWRYWKRREKTWRENIERKLNIDTPCLASWKCFANFFAKPLKISPAILSQKPVVVFLRNSLQQLVSGHVFCY